MLCFTKLKNYCSHCGQFAARGPPLHVLQHLSNQLSFKYFVKKKKKTKPTNFKRVRVGVGKTDKVGHANVYPSTHSPTPDAPSKHEFDCRKCTHPHVYIILTCLHQRTLFVTNAWLWKENKTRHQTYTKMKDAAEPASDGQWVDVFYVSQYHGIHGSHAPVQTIQNARTLGAHIHYTSTE
jgi:hypothetical protein